MGSTFISLYSHGSPSKTSISRKYSAKFAVLASGNAIILNSCLPSGTVARSGIRMFVGVLKSSRERLKGEFYSMIVYVKVWSGKRVAGSVVRL